MISAQQLQQVSAWLEQKGRRGDMEAQLRADFPDLHFTFCSDEDVMSDKLAAATAGYNLYLIDASNHCLCLTQDMATASGVVVAETEDDE